MTQPTDKPTPSKYYAKQGTEAGVECADEYQILYRPDGSEVTCITEPEDRTFGRDLAPIVDELNRLLAKVEQARKFDPHGGEDA